MVRVTAVADPNALLEVEGLHTTYPLSSGVIASLRRRPKRVVRAVDGVSFSVGAGEMLALVGESGCGKTTTAQSVLHLVEPTSGTVRFMGRTLADLSKRDLRSTRLKMQMIYQDPYESLDPRFSVRQTIEEPMLIHRLNRSRDERRSAVFEALERVGLTPPELYVDRYPHELSGGQRQRVAIAAALVLNPRLLVADEPVSMLDVSVRAGILSLLDDLRRNDGMGILMITHDLSTAAHFADRIAVMYLGRIVEHGPAKEVVSNPQHPYTQALLSATLSPDPSVHKDRIRLAGEIPGAAERPPGCPLYGRCPIGTEECAAAPVPLHPYAPDHLVACIKVGSLPANGRVLVPRAVL
jgi:peptide/nickel transport system ATP-binding protein